MMINNVKLTIEKNKMLKQGNSVMVCVSGGADSMSLLCALLALKNELGLAEVFACHFNHGLRGTASDSDEAYVVDFCNKNDIRLICGYGDMTKKDKPKGESTESWSRKLRYEFFLSSVGDSNTKIALAHNKNDCVETAIFNMVRGSGIKGLRGVPTVRENFIRPLIETSREEIEAFCAENDISFCIDATNYDTIYSRNRIRKNILPQMMMINQNAVNNIFRFCENANEISNYFEKQAKKLIEKSQIEKNSYLIDNILLEECIIVKFALKAIIQPYMINVSEVSIQLALRIVNGQLREMELAKNVYLASDGTRIYVYKRDQQLLISSNFEKNISCGFNELSAETCVNVQKSSFDKNKYKNLTKNLLNNSVDCDKILGNMVLRTKRDGDLFCSYLKKNTKTLKKLFNEAKFSNIQRASTPIVCDNQGIIWIKGFGITPRVKVNENTKNIITFS